MSLYGSQEAVDPADPDCGNGIFDGGVKPVTNPLDTSVAVDAGFLAGWVQHLVSQFGSASDGGVRFYALGNQPALAHVTHGDVHPNKATYAESRQWLTDGTAAVKPIDPGAKTYGPGEWGWLNYFDSAAGERSDAGIDFVADYLRHARALEMQRGSRQLDYFDLHIFPQAVEADDPVKIVRGDVTPAIRALRLRSTRTLWDPTYATESWERCCYAPVMRVLPRMRDWVLTNYPGTPLAVSSYDWGAPTDTSGALAQAEVLGIFGREGVELAMRETAPPDNAILEQAFRLYRNFDGQGSTFGDISVFASSSEWDRVSAFAAYDLFGRITLVIINKTPSSPSAAVISFLGLTGATWRAYGFDDVNRTITASGNGTFMGNTLIRAMQPYSAEIIELYPTGFTDGGVPDAGTDGGVDAGVDGGEDAGVDSGVPDAGVPDAGVDADTPDAGTPDAGHDAGTDAGPSVDAGPTVDAGMTSDAGMTPGGGGGCGCSTSSAMALWPFAMLAWLQLLRRREWRRAR